MIITMRREASSRDIEYVVHRTHSLGLKTHLTVQDQQTLIGVVGDLHGLDVDALAGLRGVEKIQPLNHPYRLASREFKKRRTIVSVDGVEIGAERVVTMAGPCAVETHEQVLQTAQAVKAAGARMLRGGAFKPRTSPYSFHGLADEGLKILADVREKTGLPIVTEVISSEQVPLVSRYADVLQIGARNMQNFALLNAVGESGRPVLLKRGMMSTIEELLLSAEYILARGNVNVILCERGIRTFETATRNTLDINAVPLLKELTHLPVIVDPSHATGRSSLVKAVSRASVAAGADGLLIEVHPDPEHAWSDGYQSLTLGQFDELVREVRPVAAAVGRAV